MAKTPENKVYAVDYTVDLYGRAYVQAPSRKQAKFIVENQMEINKLIRFADPSDRPDNVYALHASEVKSSSMNGRGHGTGIL
jgi:hypothetical protein